VNHARAAWWTMQLDRRIARWHVAAAGWTCSGRTKRACGYLDLESVVLTPISQRNNRNPRRHGPLALDGIDAVLAAEVSNLVK